MFLLFSLFISIVSSVIIITHTQIYKASMYLYINSLYVYICICINAPILICDKILLPHVDDILVIYLLFFKTHVLFFLRFC